MADKKTRLCPKCYGSKVYKGSDCPRCGGKGRVPVRAPLQSSSPQLGHTGRDEYFDLIRRADTAEAKWIAVRAKVKRTNELMPSYWGMSEAEREQQNDLMTADVFEVRGMTAPVPELVPPDNGFGELDDDTIRGWLAGPAY
jgi:hypothetical protein